MIAYILLYLIIFFTIIFFLLGVFFTIFASRISSWGIQMLFKMGGKSKELLGTEENIFIILQWPFSKRGFLTWWLRIVGVLLSAFAAWGLYMLFTEGHIIDVMR